MHEYWEEEKYLAFLKRQAQRAAQRVTFVWATIHSLSSRSR